MRLFLSALFFAMCFKCLEVRAGEVRILTEDWPPFSYYDAHGKATGLSVDLLLAAQEYLGYRQKIEFLPWNRAYRIALKEPNVLIFSMARTPERENSFKWVGAIYERKINLYKLKKRSDIKLESIEDARHYKIGANTENDASTRTLLSLGFIQGVNMELIHGKDQQNLQKLLLGRVDLIVSSDIALNFEAIGAGHSLNEFEQALVLPTAENEQYYFAFSPSTPDATVAEYRRAFEKAHKDGAFERIRKRYLNSQ